MKHKKVIIIGAGIAGPAIAIALSKLGYEPEIFEARQKSEMNDGVFLGLTPNGLNALKEFTDLVNIKDEYTAGTMVFFNSGNQKIAELNTSHQLSRYGAETIQVKRAAVSRALLEETINCGIPIHYDSKLLSLIQQGDKVSATFDNAKCISADVVIGCDGAFSVCRKCIFPDLQKPVYTQQLSTGAFVQMDGETPEFGSINMTFGEKAFFAYATSNKGKVWWFNNFYRKREPSRHELNTSIQDEIKTTLIDLHRNDPAIIRKIVEKTDDIFVYPIYEMPVLPAWHKGNVCLIGDAAHATSPHIGQGASMALEDSLVLAKCIRDYPDLETAFSHYEQIRKPRVHKLVKTARKIGNNKSKANPVATFFRDKLLRYFIKSEIKKMDWIYNYKVEWNNNGKY